MSVFLQIYLFKSPTGEFNYYNGQLLRIQLLSRGQRQEDGWSMWNGTAQLLIAIYSGRHCCSSEYRGRVLPHYVNQTCHKSVVYFTFYSVCLSVSSLYQYAVPLLLADWVNQENHHWRHSQTNGSICRGVVVNKSCLNYSQLQVQQHICLSGIEHRASQGIRKCISSVFHYHDDARWQRRDDDVPQWSVVSDNCALCYSLVTIKLRVAVIIFCQAGITGGDLYWFGWLIYWIVEEQQQQQYRIRETAALEFYKY